VKKTILLLLFIFCIPSHAQIIKDTVKHQENRINDLPRRPRNDSLPLIEKVYLHTDRTCYYSGEDLWFKAYLIEASGRLLSDLSNNLHVELISPSSKIILSRTIRMESGLGNGDLKLPDDIRSGSYKLRAYTNYMRNFSDQVFFTKEIIVINPADKQDEIAQDVKYVEKNIQLYFFPEGGSLVDNVSSIVAFKAVDNFDKGCYVSGKIYSSAGDLITTFRSTHLGMGSFLFRPLPGLRYYSIFRGADSINIRTELPRSFSTGVTLGVSKARNNELLVTTSTNPQTLQLVSDHDLLLIFSARKEVIRTMHYRIKTPVTSFVIPADDLPDGIIMLSLSAPGDLPLSERLLYIQREAPLSVQIETDKQIYNKRDPVSLTISLSGDSTADDDANVSLSVVDKKLTNNTSLFPTTISSWFLLESDVHGYVEDPSYYFDPSNPNRFRDLDLLLLTQGWRDFAWKYDTIYFPPERGFTISGRLRKNYINKSIEGSRVSIGIFAGENTFLTTAPVDSAGKFRLSGIDFTGDARLIVSGIGKKDRLQGLLNLDSVTYMPAKVAESSPQKITLLVEKDLSGLKTQYKINEAIRKKYKLSDTIPLSEVNVIAERHKDPQIIKVESSRAKYGTPEFELMITDQMVHFPYLIEVLRGRIPGLVIFGSYPDYKIQIRGPSTLAGSVIPLVLIDGNYADFDDLLYMPINFVDRIDVLKSVGATAIFGIRGANGVINIITKSGGAINGYKSVSYAINIKAAGYDAPRVFYSPQHLPVLNSTNAPDLRSTLLWKPYLNVGSNKDVYLNYFNGDNSSLIRVTAEGITTNGIPVTGTIEYEVR
jgi:hypothetical protein